MTDQSYKLRVVLGSQPFGFFSLSLNLNLSLSLSLSLSFSLNLSLDLGLFFTCLSFS